VPDSHTAIAKKIVELIHAERKRRNWSQETLAVAADVSNSCVRHLEHGRSTPTFVNLLKLADALDLDFAALLQTARHAVGGKRPRARS